MFVLIVIVLVWFLMLYVLHNNRMRWFKKGINDKIERDSGNTKYQMNNKRFVKSPTNMFGNVGNTIKKIAEILCIMGSVGSAVLGSWICTIDDEWILVGIATIFGGILVSWAICAFLYGFGQLVDNSDKLVNKLAPDDYDNAE